MPDRPAARRRWTPRGLWLRARRRTTSGCYVCRSRTLDDLYRTLSGDPGGIVAKIGYSKDIEDRALELAGWLSPRRYDRGYEHKGPYAHFEDWQLWRVHRNVAGKSLDLLEKELQAAHTKLPVDLYNHIHRAAGYTATPPDIRELFIIDRAALERDFPEVVQSIKDPGWR